MPENAIAHHQGPRSGPSASGREQPGFTTHWEGDAVLTCVGELDPVTNPALRRSLNRVLRLAPDRVVVDLSQVSFFDAGAIGELVWARTKSRAAGGDLVVRGPSPQGRRELGIVGLTGLIAQDAGPASDASGAFGRLAGRRDEVVSAWEAACRTARYGAAALVFDPTSMIRAMLASVDDPTSETDAAPPDVTAARGEQTSPATAVMQLWALSDVLHAETESTGARSDHEERRRRGLETLLAAMAAAAVAELEQTTLVDPLTGLLNRRALDRDLLQALASARRHSHDLSVVVIDIEGLKATNDQLGHAAGDDALRALATSLASALRSGDNAYRIGGDEFVLVLPDLHPDDVDVVMGRTVVGAQETFTWGCAGVDGDDDASDVQRAANLLEHADARMLDYRARVTDRSGRRAAPVLPPQAPAEVAEELTGLFTAGNRSSVVIDAAKGLIAEHFDIGINEASTMLFAFSAAQGRPLRALAVALTDRTVDLEQLAPHRPRPSAAPRHGAHLVVDDRAPSAGR